MGRWLAGRLMKELGLVSCQQPTHRYKRGGHEHIVIPNRLERQFAVTEPNQVLRHCVVSARFLSLLEKRTVIDLIGVEIVRQIVHFTSSLSDVYELTIKRRNMLPGE